jgi:hypothetical protein
LLTWSCYYFATAAIHAMKSDTQFVCEILMQHSTLP